MNPALTSDPWIGRLIGEHQRYRLDKRLGVGGMGDVFVAMDTRLGKQVALKLLKEPLAAAENLRKRFEREVAVCAALKSDHIVQVNDYGVTAEGHPFYVMEYLQGQTLGQLLRSEKQLSVERTVRIVSQICKGLRLAHEGVTLWRDGATVSEHVLVVHRDLKPDNIFLVPTDLGEMVKILDFGIAKIRNDTSEHTNLTSMFMGTYHYAAPEQLQVEKDLDGRADIYSLGIILYEMLCGTDPFGFGLNIRSISGVSWVLAHTSKQPQPLRSQPGSEQVSPELEAVVMRCLQKSPDERFRSVEELNRALRAAVAVPQTSIPPVEVYVSDPTVHRPLIPIISQSQPPTPIATNPQNLNNSLAQVSPLPLSTLVKEPEIRSSNVPLPRRFPSLLTGAGIAIAITVTAGYIYLRSQPSETEILVQVRALQAKAKYAECITKAKTVTGSSLYVKAQELLNQCQLGQAKKLAAEGRLAHAIVAASTITKNSPLYSAAQVLSNQWSKRMITLATEQLQAGKLDTAIAIAQAIPATSPVYQQAQLAISQWQKDWQLAQTQFSIAQKALDQGRWQVAIDGSNRLPNISFWKEKIKPVVQKARFQIVKLAEAQAQQRQAQAEAQAQQRQAQADEPSPSSIPPSPSDHSDSVPSQPDPTPSSSPDAGPQEHPSDDSQPSGGI